ncbi:MAG: permease-like cell division protein FtsX [Gammaproteobacteria bacterium]
MQRTDRGPARAPRPAPQSGIRTPQPGASARRLSLGDRFVAGVRHHRETAAQSLIRLAAAPVQSLMTVLVIAIALALPTSLYLVVASLQQLAGGLDAGNRLTLYLHLDTAPKAMDGLLAQLREHAGVSAVQFISAEQGLTEFKASSGFGDVLDLLDHNPLPPVVVVTARDQPSAAALTTLADAFAKLPSVEAVQIDTQWVARANAIATIGRQAALALATVLALGVLLIVGNTIRLAIENCREEILVVKLVGGTDAFARRPFLYMGFWYGLGGGILSCIMVAAGRWWLHYPVDRLAALYQSQWGLARLGVVESFALVIAAGVLGALGARLAAGLQMRAIEP